MRAFDLSFVCVSTGNRRWMGRSIDPKVLLGAARGKRLILHG